MRSASTFVSHSARKTNTTMRAVATALVVFIVIVVGPDAGVSVVDGVLFKDHNGPHVPDRIVFGKPGGLLQRSTTAPISSSTTPATAAVDAVGIPPGFEANVVLPRTNTQQAPPQKTTTLPVASAVAPITAAAATPPAPAPTHVHDGCRLLPSTDGTLMYECSPSSTPSAAPTDVPSVSPSTTPTLSSQPSLSPSRSVQPSVSPSVSPSEGPSASPSVSPTDVPSVSPSLSPSYSPTQVSQKMKSAVTSLLLEDIAAEMDMVTAAEFELLTVAFLQKKIAPTETYTLATLAVNVVSQTRITNSLAAAAEDPTAAAAAVDKNDANTNTDAFNLSPDHTPNGTRRHVRRGRQLEKETWTVALVVDIRTVGEVTEGRVPKTFNYTKEVDYAFYNHWDQYLWQLGTTIPFFEPLIDVSDYVPQTREEVIIDQKYNRKKKNNGAFAFGILFSLVAFGLAMFASYLAIRKHMKNGEGYDGGGASIFRKQYRNVTTPAAAGKGKNRRKSGGVRVSPKNSPPGYSGPEVINYLTKTRTMSDDDSSYHDGRAEGGGAIAFVNNIDVDKHCHLENIALTPRRSSSPTHNNINVARDGLFVVDEESGDDESCSKSLKNKIKNAHQESSSSPMTGLGGQLRNWLSPKGKSLMSTIRNTTTAMGGEDRGPYHHDPPTTAAAKAVVTQKSPAPASPADLSPTGGGPEGGFTLPISFFSNHRSSDGNNGDDESPMSSLADSNASSFFAIGNMNKTFAGRRSSAENNAVHSGAVEASSYSNENHHHAGSILHGYSNSNNSSNYVVKSNNKADSGSIAAAASVHSIMRTKNSDTNNSKQRTTGGHTHQHIAVPSIMHTQSSDSETSAVQRLKAQFEGKHNQTQPHYHYQQQPEPKPLREIQNTTNNEYENSLVGAVSRASQEEGQEIQYNPSFGSARSIFSPQKSGQSNDRSTPFGFGGNSNRGGGQQLETAKSEASTSTLGARPMDRTANSNSSVANNDDDNKSTLTKVMNCPESYDVYAPSGPIGVVVDTSHKGPAVHSLKATSPMLGLITPGDLIIALDGEDTRKMSAAALTRLMAKKSRQRERKITLFSGDGF